MEVTACLCARSLAVWDGEEVNGWWTSGQFSLDHHVSSWKPGESQNSLYESGFPGSYEGIFVMLGG